MRRFNPAAQAAGLALFLAAAGPAAAGGLEDEVLDEINYARANPRQYAQELRREDVAVRQGRGSATFANEDPDAVEEAIDFLMRQPPLPPLKPDARLAAAARAHAVGQGRRGDVGHGGPGGETLGGRLKRHGVWAGISAENISYGYDDARDVVRQLIVDSRVAGRGHRANIFGRAYQSAGVGCGGHGTYGAMCVIDFAGAFAAR